MLLFPIDTDIWYCNEYRYQPLIRKFELRDKEN